jgi:hypothetical protein
VIDTDLFVGGDVVDAPAKSVIIREIPGSIESWSSLEQRMIQILCLDLAYIDAETLSRTVYDLLANKPGFSGSDLASESIFFCESFTMPTPLERNERGSFIFSMTFIIRKE